MIVEKMVTKMVNNPSNISKEREKNLNKKIEQVFELESFQRMVENQEGRLGKLVFKDYDHSKNFIRSSELI